MSQETRMTATGNHEWVAIEAGVQASVDCAKICVNCAKTVAAGTVEAEELCQYSAEACDHYADEFARHEDAASQIFAKACRTFAGECRAMAGFFREEAKNQ